MISYASFRFIRILLENLCCFLSLCGWTVLVHIFDSMILNPHCSIFCIL